MIEVISAINASEAPFYWMIQEDGCKSGAFCQKCYDDNNKLIRLPNFSSGNTGAWKCNVCDSFYTSVAYNNARNSDFKRANKHNLISL